MASLLVVPLTLHLVSNDRYRASWRAAQVEELMQEVNERWAPAHITFTPNIVTTPVATQDLRASFLNASQRSDRDGRCGQLRPLCRGALDIFMVDCLTYYDADTAVEYVHYKWAKLGLFSLQIPHPGPQLANLLGALLGGSVGSQEARPEARALATRVARPTLKLPPLEVGLVIHQVQQESYGTNRSGQDVQLRQATRLGGEESDLLGREDLPEPSAGPLRKPPSEEEGGAHYRISDVPRGDTLESITRDLDALVGLAPIKKRLRTLMNLARAEQSRREGGTPGFTINLHQVFSGAPGTGKTTVARLMGRIYRVTGLLRRGHTLETDRSGLVSGWRGRTPLRVNTVVDKALHGVLFIDEAYALIGHHDADGPHAVSTLMKRMEDQRDELAVILAGYSQAMEQFLEANPGLRSRFGTPLEFVDYGPEELLAIFDTFCRPGHFTLTEEARESLLDLLTRHYRRRDRTFGNGRFVRGLFEQMVERQADRLAEGPGPADLRRFEAADVPPSEPRGHQLGLRQARN